MEIIDPKNTKKRMEERLAMMHKLYSDSEVKHFFSPSEPLTNADRIRSMTDEELAEWIAYRQGCFERQDKRCSKYGTCRDCWFDWLKEEYTP